MGTVNVTLGEDARLNLILGQQLENAVTSVVFDFSAWQTAYGSGTLALSVQRPGDEQPYAVTLTTSGTDATWSVTNLDTAYKGVGHIQLTYTVGSAIKKSVVYKFTVYESLGANGEYPSPGQTWQEEIEDELDDVKQDLYGYAFGLDETFTHYGSTGWEYFPCFLFNNVGYKVTNNNANHTMAVNLKKKDGTTVSVGSATASGTLYFVVPSSGDFVEIGGYMYNGASFNVTNEYSNYDAVSKKANISELKLSNNGEQTFGMFGNFQHYGLDVNGGFLMSQKYRVSNNNPMTFNRDLIINVKTGYKWGYDKFDNSTATWSGWFTSMVILPANTSFVVQIARISENTSEIADIDEFVNAVTFLTTVGENVSKTPQIVNSLGMGDMELTWESGGIGSGGVNSVDARRIRTKDYIEMGDVLDVIAMAGYYFGVSQYDSNYTRLSDTGWTQGSYTVQKYQGAKYFRCVLAKTVSGTTTIDVSDATNITIRRAYNNLGVRVFNLESAFYGGTDQYVGEKIPSKVNSYSYKKIFRMTYDGTTETSQDIDIYGLYFVVAFAKNDNQSIKIYSMEDYSLLANISINVQHGSGIQFSNEFYDESDIMPLLYVGGWTTNEINVIRITKSGDTWGATIIRTLKLSTDEGYYLAPSLDNQNNILYCYGYKIQSLAATNNAMKIVKCDLSNLTANGDGTYSPAIINRIETPYMGVMQGRKYYKGRLYIGFANTSGSADCRLVCVDVSNGETKTDIDLSGMVTVESEGVCYRIVGNEILWYYSDFNNVFEMSFSI